MDPLAYSATGSSAARENESESDTLSVHTDTTSTAGGESVHPDRPAPGLAARPSSMRLDDIDHGFSEEEIERFVTREREESKKGGGTTLWVDWDGPDDKADPKQWVVHCSTSAAL